MDQPKTILLVGLPRSGTTWVGNVLGLADDMQFVHEPDNEKVSLIGKRLKSDVPRFPNLKPGDVSLRYRKLWELAVTSPHAMSLSRSQITRVCKAINPWRDAMVRSKEWHMVQRFYPTAAMDDVTKIAVTREQPRLIKTVHGVLCVEWICSVVPIDRVVVVMRHPLAILASLRRLKMPDAVRPYTLSPRVVQAVVKESAVSGLRIETALHRQALHLAVLYRGLIAQVKRNPAWVLAVHEDLCMNPVQKFRSLYEQIGLPFTPQVEAGIVERNKSGTGFTPNRDASQEVGKWEKDYTEQQQKQVTDILIACGLAPWL